MYMEKLQCSSARGDDSVRCNVTRKEKDTATERERERERNEKGGRRERKSETVQIYTCKQRAAAPVADA